MASASSVCRAEQQWHALQFCSGGRCQCPSGLSLCSGACVSTKNDPNHCGGCGKKCGTSQFCSNGTCVTACPSGQQVCSGRCVNTNTDRTNCGTCGKVCPSNSTCSSGSCRCNSGLTLCSNVCVNTQTSTTNCGGCGRRCGSGQICQSGSCVGQAVTYSERFTQGQAGTKTARICTQWIAFQSRISASRVYNKITLSGSRNTTGVTCTGSAANTLCQAIRTNNRSVQVTCNGRTWRTNTCFNSNGFDRVELTADNRSCSCTSNYVVRPCIGNANWGGINGSSCSATTQTITVRCE